MDIIDSWILRNRISRDPVCKKPGIPFPFGYAFSLWLRHLLLGLYGLRVFLCLAHQMGEAGFLEEESLKVTD
ncbi:hypothetical protein NE619_17565 [Anaerovorax odorimutans]|uniref:Uncharacterized protein n=1 Tax=Anaerovorax odorimutans TaxID=109327 RepID=A0ABT1RTK9_9FIRM|nr:hypothetical protein [Anaerovorax odorimutans]MCQ4638539.1 hypothetical protein [Anaerovorax odorimutans]